MFMFHLCFTAASVVSLTFAKVRVWRDAGYEIFFEIIRLCFLSVNFVCNYVKNV